jgi:hypothetical protein
MRYINLSGIFALVTQLAHASCATTACYSVTFSVQSCELQQSTFAPPSKAAIPAGVLLGAKDVVAHVVVCSLGEKPRVLGGKPEVQDEHAFFYQVSGHEQAACREIEGKKVTLFAPERCAGKSFAPLPARELLALPIYAQ